MLTCGAVVGPRKMEAETPERGIGHQASGIGNPGADLGFGLAS